MTEILNAGVPQIVDMYTYQPLTARYWVNYRAGQTGWLLVENLSTHDPLRIHFNEAGNDTSNYKIIKPLHSKPFQIAEGDQVWFSTETTNVHIRVENARYKPVLDEYYIDEGAVENIPFSDEGVAITTTYDCTTLEKGYCTRFQVGAETAFTGTVEYSANNGVTYSSPIVVAYPGTAEAAGTTTKQLFGEEDRVVTHIRVTRNAGTFFIWYR